METLRGEDCELLDIVLPMIHRWYPVDVTRVMQALDRWIDLALGQKVCDAETIH
jgi:hypothetical protein